MKQINDIEKHCRRSIRLKEYNYTHPGAYFITICTQHRKYLLGNIVDGKMVLNSIGKLAEKWWLKLPEKFPEIELDEYIVMPNHFHGIIIIVWAIHELPIRNRRNMLLSRVIGYFKMNSAKHINHMLNQSGKPFWQRNYYEHIIRRREELSHIREYIINNPLQWQFDRENPHYIQDKEYKNKWGNIEKIIYG